MNESNYEGGQPLPSVPSDAMFGSPLAAVTDADQLREMLDKLWSLLDDIDTASDQFKPRNEAGYRHFYEYAMKKVAARHATITSDGYDLYLPNASVTGALAAARTVDAVLADIQGSADLAWENAQQQEAAGNIVRAEWFKGRSVALGEVVQEMRKANNDLSGRR